MDSPEFKNLLVVIGASAGGLAPIKEIIQSLPEHFSGTLMVATHRDPELPGNLLADILEQNTRLTVRDPVKGEKLLCQTLYVGPPSKALTVDRLFAGLEKVEEEVLRIERIDRLFETAAKYGEENTVGVILSGLLSDGIEGLKAIQAAGGCCIVQSPGDAQFDSMPVNALNEIDADFVGTDAEIAERLTEIAAGRTCQ
ncbi:MAG: chemotaxis protein CheB [Planctomycetota bacterium]